jgi:hypothetical protein
MEHDNAQLRSSGDEILSTTVRMCIVMGNKNTVIFLRMTATRFSAPGSIAAARDPGIAATSQVKLGESSFARI